jgi:hypothetical protein
MEVGAFDMDVLPMIELEVAAASEEPDDRADPQRRSDDTARRGRVDEIALTIAWQGDASGQKARAQQPLGLAEISTG